MSDLRPEDIALLDLARAGHEPSETDRVRVRKALAASLGAGAGLSVTTATSAAGAGAPATATSRLLGVGKVLGAAAILVGTLGGGVSIYHAVRGPQPLAHPAKTEALRDRLVEAPSPRSNASPPDRGARASPVGGITPSDRIGATDDLLGDVRPKASTNLGPTMAPLAGSAQSRSAAPAGLHSASTPAACPSPPAWKANAPGGESPPGARDAPTMLESAPVAARLLETPLAPAEPTTIEAETRLVRSALQARRAGDGARALRLLDEYALAYPNGVLGEEGAAERVFVLCDLGRIQEARAASAEFMRTWPRSMLSERVRASCAARANP